MQNSVVGTLALVCASVVPVARVQAQQILHITENSTVKPTPPAASALTPVPALVPYSSFGVAVDGKPIVGEVPVTFLIFKDETGGEPVFTESQVAAFDVTGHYQVQLGATLSSGIPIDLFGTGEARWLEVQISGASVTPRVLLASVPYALKAGDASTLGGLPASAYALASSVKTQAASGLAPGSVTPDTGSTAVTTTGGTTGFLPVFNGAATIVDSILFQASTGIGVGTTPNARYKLDVNGPGIFRGSATLPSTANATASAGTDSFPLTLYGGSYNSSTAKNQLPTFYLQVEPTGNNTTAPGGTLNLLYNSNFGTGAETGLHFNSNGIIAFASGQTFPGTGAGTITGVTAGTGLTGGGTSGKVTLAINTGVVPQLAGTNSFSGSDTFVNSLYEDLDVNIDNKNANSGAISPGLRLGSASGEGMASKRTSGGNQYGVDLYTNYLSRLAINESGQVAIGTSDAFTSAQLYVVSSGGYGILAQGGDSASQGYSGGTGGGFVGGDGAGNGDGGDALYISGGSSDSDSGGDGLDSYGGETNTGQGGTAGYFDGGDSGTGGTGGIGVVAIGGYGHDANNNAIQADAADLYGNETIQGSVTYKSAATKIDHPLDPANKYLSQAVIESSEMVNIYSGNVTTDEQGLATVQLPTWFESINADLRYQLTAIGHKAQAWVSGEVKDGRFQIASDMANVKVSWQITGVRQDAYAKAHPLTVEGEKSAREKAFYQHPELYGQPARKQSELGRDPKTMHTIQLVAAKRAAATTTK